MIRIDKVIAVFLACSILLSIFPFKIIYADTVAPRVSDNEYVYLDLYYGNITISSSGYSGYVLENGVVTQKTGTIDKKIYLGFIPENNTYNSVYFRHVVGGKYKQLCRK